MTVTCLQVNLMASAAIIHLKELWQKEKKKHSLKAATLIFNCAYSSQKAFFVCLFVFSKAAVKVKYHLHKHPWSKMALNFIFCMCKWSLDIPERANWPQNEE